MSKLNVGVGADFPVDAAEPSPKDDERAEGCDSRHFRRHYRRRFGSRHGWRRGRFFWFGPAALIVFIALISLAVSYPMVVLGLVAIAALAFAARHHHWHDHDDWDGRGGNRRDGDDFERRGHGFDPRETGPGPQPDAPSSGPSQARS